MLCSAATRQSCKKINTSLERDLENSPLSLLHPGDIHWSKMLHYSTNRTVETPPTQHPRQRKRHVNTRGSWSWTQHWMFTEKDKPVGGHPTETQEQVFLQYTPLPKFWICKHWGRSVHHFLSLRLMEKEVSRFLSPLKLLNRAPQRGTQESWDDSEISWRI